MLLGARLGATFSLGAVPVWEGATELAASGCYAAGLAANREHREGAVVADGVSEEEVLPLYDPQTSGGLLIAVALERAEALVRELEAVGEWSAVVGEVTDEPTLRVTV
jgi:selenide,water dikinase